MELINNNWQQTIAFLVEKNNINVELLTEFLMSNGISKEETIQLLALNRNLLINKIEEILKKKPIVNTIILTRYINTETTKYVYVNKREDIRPDRITTQTLNYDPNDGWIDFGSGWKIKEDRFGRKYYKMGDGGILSESQYLSRTKKWNDNDLNIYKCMNSNIGYNAPW